MFDLAAFFLSAKDALPIVPPLIQVLRELEKEKDPSLMRALVEVRIQATDACKSLREEISTLARDLGDLRIDLDKPLSEVYRDLSWLKDFSTKMLLAKHRRAMAAVHVRLSGATDDLAAVLLCAEKMHVVSGAYDAGASIRKDLDAMAMDEPTIRQLLTTYGDITDNYIKYLHP